MCARARFDEFSWRSAVSYRSRILRGTPIASTRTGVGATAATTSGTFVAPTVIEIDDINVLKKEVFGPVLSVIKFKEEDEAVTIANDVRFENFAALKCLFYFLGVLWRFIGA